MRRNCVRTFLTGLWIMMACVVAVGRGARAQPTMPEPGVREHRGVEPPAELRSLEVLCRRVAELRRVRRNIAPRLTPEALWEYHLVFREIFEHATRASRQGVAWPGCPEGINGARDGD